MSIRSSIRGGAGAGRGDNAHYSWHPSMGTPHPSEAGSGSGGGKKPPRTAVATGDDDNVYNFNEFAENKKKKKSEGDYGES